MFVNAFMGMDFTDDGRGVVFHFLNAEGLAEEYLFEQAEDASKFYMMCLRFLEEFKEEEVEHQEKLFREFLRSDLVKMNYVRTEY